jgi:transposase
MLIPIVPEILDLPTITSAVMERVEGSWEIFIERATINLPCSGCGEIGKRTFHHSLRRLRDLSVFGKKTFIVFDEYRVDCPRCGYKVEKLPFAAPWARMTLRFSEYVAQLVRISTVKDAADTLGLDWETVKEIDKAYLQKEFGAPDFDNLRILCLDEISRKKRHKYFTVAMNYEKTKVIWVGKDREQQTAEAFFEALGPERCGKIEAVCVDMWDPYIAAIRKYCPQAKIIYDKFHVIQAYSRVIDKVRNREAERAAEDHKAVFKGSKYLLLRNVENLRPSQKGQLRELLELNANLNKVYVLKEHLKRLWDYTYPAVAERHLDEWINMARNSRIEPLKEFAKMLDRRRDGVLSHCRFKINNGRIEGTNNKIKVVKRKAYGFHDDEYFILKIKQACHGKEIDPTDDLLSVTFSR